MIDKKGFVKLFDLNIPNIDHLDYYIDQLSKSRKFKNIKEIIPLYEKAESQIDDLYNFRVEKSKEVINFIKESNAWIELCLDKSLIDYPTSKSFRYEEDRKYLSIDIRNANWHALKKYDPDHVNELGRSYNDLLDKFQFPEIFKHSKYLRQFIFGNIESKKISKVQRNIIQEIVRKYENNLTIECVRADEAIFSFDDFKDLNVLNIDESRFKTKIFSVSRVEDFRIDTIFDLNSNILDKELVNLDDNLFYIKLKEYITKESMDVRDFYFRNSGRLAVWNDPRIEIQIKNG